MNKRRNNTGCCTGGSVEVSVGARTGADIVGAMLVAPEEVGVDMRSGASEGVAIAKGRARTGHHDLTGPDAALARLIARETGRY